MAQHGLIQQFFAWYERHYRVALTITTILFFLQIVHLYWLAAHVISDRLLGYSFFTPSPFWQFVIILIAYTDPGEVTPEVDRVRVFVRSGDNRMPVPVGFARDATNSNAWRVTMMSL